jgi:hypothetical protein
MIPSECHDWAEIIRAVSDINDTVIVHALAFEERFEFLTYRGSSRALNTHRMVCGLGVTFANIHVATSRAVVLWPIGIDVPPEFEQARRIPLSGIGHYPSEEILQPFGLLYVRERVVIFVRLERDRRRRTVTYFQDRRDINRVGAGETEECRLWLRCRL